MTLTPLLSPTYTGQHVAFNIRKHVAFNMLHTVEGKHVACYFNNNKE